MELQVMDTALCKHLYIKKSITNQLKKTHHFCRSYRLVFNDDKTNAVGYFNTNPLNKKGNNIKVASVFTSTPPHQVNS